MKLPLIALEVVLGFVVPLGWAVRELLLLRRDRRRTLERQAAADASAKAAPTETKEP